MRPNLLFTLILLLTPLTAIGQNPGQVTERIKCNIDTSHQYALYLPGNYVPQKSWPALFIYDAQGNGTVGIDRFKAGAEKYGYILVGSYNYRNGPVDKGFEAARILLEEVTQEWSVDMNRIYTAGMSGGARMASTVGVVTGRIAGVIAIGAAFNFMNEPSEKSHFDLVGITGDKDMNYRELPRAREVLRDLGASAHVITYDGKHRWCHEKQATEALEWLEVMAMKKGLKAQNTEFLNAFEQKKLQEADSLYKAEKLVAAQALYQSISLNFPETQAKAAQGKLEKLSGQKAFKKQQKAWERLMEKEYQKEVKFRAALKQVKSVVTVDSVYDWWKDEIRKLNQNLLKAKTDELKNSAKRSLGFIGLFCFSTASQHMYQQNWNEALPYFMVVSRISPGHPDVNYFMAKMYALNDMDRQSKWHLKQATKAGFHHPEQSEIDRNALLDTSEFFWLSGRVVEATF